MRILRLATRRSAGASRGGGEVDSERTHHGDDVGVPQRHQGLCLRRQVLPPHRRRAAGVAAAAGPAPSRAPRRRDPLGLPAAPAALTSAASGGWSRRGAEPGITVEIASGAAVRRPPGEHNGAEPAGGDRQDPRLVPGSGSDNEARVAVGRGVVVLAVEVGRGIQALDGHLLSGGVREVLITSYQPQHGDIRLVLTERSDESSHLTPTSAWPSHHPLL
jgi:hypothetical protein